MDEITSSTEEIFVLDVRKGAGVGKAGGIWGAALAVSAASVLAFYPSGAHAQPSVCTEVPDCLRREVGEPLQTGKGVIEDAADPITEAVEDLADELPIDEGLVPDLPDLRDDKPRPDRPRRDGNRPEAPSSPSDTGIEHPAARRRSPQARHDGAEQPTRNRPDARTPPQALPQLPSPSAGLGGAALETARRFGFPLLLALGVMGYLLVQSVIDRRDPRLASAPVDNDMVTFA